jgi:glucose/arabinose dehydrogenase
MTFSLSRSGTSRQLAVVVFLLCTLCAGCAAGGAAADQTPPGNGAAGERRAGQTAGGVLTGKAALGDWTTDAPGVRRRITPADLPQPFATESVDNGPRLIARPEGAWPKAPVGFHVEEFANGLQNPRLLRTAPNGDVFVAESRPGRIRVLRAKDGAGKAETSEVFAAGLDRPFGIAFYPPGPEPRFVYVANTGAVVRFPYRSGDLKARGPAETIVADIPGGGQLRGGGHWTRDVVFSKDGRRMFVSVGSHSNVSDDERETRRACVLEFTPEGKNERVYASGVRNAVGLAVNPQTGELWASVNERDGLGDDLVPDYVTRLREGGFYGWPWFYLGPNQDPRHKGKRPELRERVLLPDVLVQSHSASLQMEFYTGEQFPREYRGDAFAAQHGSWNRARRTGYKIIRVPAPGGAPTGEYEDFLTGFVTPQGDVWGRPVGVTVAKDGALLVTDDGANIVWRVSYRGR